MTGCVTILQRSLSDEPWALRFGDQLARDTGGQLVPQFVTPVGSGLPWEFFRTVLAGTPPDVDWHLVLPEKVLAAYHWVDAVDQLVKHWQRPLDLAFYDAAVWAEVQRTEAGFGYSPVPVSLDAWVFPTPGLPEMLKWCDVRAGKRQKGQTRVLLSWYLAANKIYALAPQPALFQRVARRSKDQGFVGETTDARTYLQRWLVSPVKVQPVLASAPPDATQLYVPLSWPRVG